MIRKLSFFILVLTSLNAGAQNQNWIATGIDGNTYNIDSIVNTGKTVLVDISANWCAPCWDFHITGIMEKLYHEFGPEGTNDLFMIFVDGDPASSMANLSGAGITATGNWIQTTPYPIIGPYGQGSAVQSNYVMNGYPTLFVHCPGSTNGVTIPMGTTYEGFLQAWKALCPAPFDNGSIDATLFDTEDRQFCDGEHPMTRLYNQGSAPMTSATVEVSVNGAVLQSKTWTGNLATDQTEDVTFENVNLVEGVEYEFNVTVPSETYTTGNTQEATLTLAPEAPDFNLTLDLNLLRTYSRTTWKLLDTNGDTVASSPPGVFLNNNFYTYTWNLTPNSCYTFVINTDAGGGICCEFGNGYYNVRSTADSLNSFLFGGEFYGYEESRTFHTPLNPGIDESNSQSGIQVYPNPTTGKFKIHSMENPVISYRIYDLMGEVIEVEINENEIDLSSQPSGIYFLRMNTGKSTIVKKINLNK